MTTNNADSEAANGASEASNGHSKAKLHGRAFYESIGSPKFIVAPMVDQSEFVRLLPIPEYWIGIRLP